MGLFDQRKDDGSGEHETATHRLSSMFVQELSFVDMAANKRKYLTLKRASNMPSANVKKENAGQAAANVADANTGTPPATDGAAPAGAMQAQVKEEITGAIADVAEKLVAVANQIDGIDVSDKPATPPVPMAITKQLSDLGAALAAMAAKYGGAPAAAATDGSVAQSAEEGGTPAGGDGATTVKADDGVPLTTAESAAIVDLLGKAKFPKTQPGVTELAKKVAAKLAIEAPAAETIVAKAGRRMAKERLERLGKAIDVLITLMKELRYENEKRAAAAKTAKTEKSAGTAPIVSIAEVSALLDHTDVIVSELAKSQGESKSLREQIATLEKRTRPSMVLPVEQPAVVGAGAERISDLFAPDMNSIVNRRQPTNHR